MSARDATATSPRPRIGFVLEQTLGHVTHTDNLRRLVGPDPSIDAVFAEIPYDVSGLPARVPGYGNWTVRAGLRTRRAIRQLRRGGHLDALFIHTQVPAIASPDHLRRIPTVVSLDATPIQYDELGAHYGHDSGSERIEHLKWRANRACFARAAAIVTWAEWTRDGLVDRYDVPADKIVVIPPGVDYERWAAIGADDGRADGAVRVLFVGGDFVRKGGDVLLDALRELRAGGVDVELDIVTRDDVPLADGVRVHHGLGPNDPELIRLYHQADVFCLPTLGDCLPMVLSEAGAVGLPLVSTDVGAIERSCDPDAPGLLVPVGDAAALADALRHLAADPDLRRRLGDEARRVVRAEFDAATNARRLVALLVDVAERPRSDMTATTLLTVSGTIPADIHEAIAAGRRPRADYLEMAAAFDAELLDYAAAEHEAGRSGRIVRPARWPQRRARPGLLPAAQADRG